ncbi:MAG: hypothetical protein R6W72_03920 [Desulfurivibrionaceae bacterium]
MDKALNSCLEKLANLQISPERDNWGKSTAFQYPGKPLLLLSVIDLAAIGALKENLVELSHELAETYNRYWETVSPSVSDNRLAATFLEVEKEGFWKMTGLKEAAGQQQIDTMGQLHNSYLGAIIDPAILPLLTDQKSRKKLRETLISNYFASELHQPLMDIALINHAAAIYRKELLSEAVAPTIKTGRGEEINRRIAALGFDSALLELYGHRCAICGIKMMTLEGQSAVGVNRIIPRRIGGSDHPNNGLALCRMCGWSFDNGLIGIGEKYEVLIPAAIRLNGNLPAHMLIFKGRSITRIKPESFRPSQDNLSWHRQNILRE